MYFEGGEEGEVLQEGRSGRGGAGLRRLECIRLWSGSASQACANRKRNALRPIS